MRLLKLFFIMCTVALMVSCTPSPEGYLVENATGNSFVNRAIVLTRSEVESYMKNPPGHDMVVVVDENGKPLPTQDDDMDGDGQWDEVAFLVNVEAHSTKTLHFEARRKEDMPDFPKLTNIRFAYQGELNVEVTSEDRLTTTDSPTTSVKFQMEGPAWENDVVGFRNYYDARNGIDIFGKRTKEMVLDSVGIRGQNYHELDDWGMDILKVGGSLGAGALGLHVGDQMFRLGPSNRGTYRFITEGPVRAIFELNYEGAVVGDRQYDIRHQISIYAGDHFYRSKVWVDGLRGDEELLTGIVNMQQKEMFRMKTGDYEVVASFGNQAYLGENLGMALLVPQRWFLETWKAPEEGEGITETHMVSLNLSKDQPTEFAFFAGWEYQDEGFAHEDYFRDMLVKAVERLE